MEHFWDKQYENIKIWEIFLINFFQHFFWWETFKKKQKFFFIFQNIFDYFQTTTFWTFLRVQNLQGSYFLFHHFYMIAYTSFDFFRFLFFVASPFYVIVLVIALTLHFWVISLKKHQFQSTISHFLFLSFDMSTKLRIRIISMGTLLSLVFVATEILEYVILTFALYSKVIFKWVNNI